jgi:hypothetical protein
MADFCYRAPFPALDQCHCAGRTVLELVSSLVNKVSGYGPVNDTQNLTHCLRVGGKQLSHRKGETDDPLAQWHIRKDFIGK